MGDKVRFPHRGISEVLLLLLRLEVALVKQVISREMFVCKGEILTAGSSSSMTRRCEEVEERGKGGTLTLEKKDANGGAGRQ